MSITFHPRIGQVLICDFDTGFRPPEMVKKRPVVIVARNRCANMATVVPLSTTPPNPAREWHHRIDQGVLPGRFAIRPTWAKCDMLYTICNTRLDRIKTKANGQRVYTIGVLSKHDLHSIRKCIAAWLGLTF